MFTSLLVSAACALASTMGTSAGDPTILPTPLQEALQESLQAPPRAEERPWTLDVFIYYWSASVSGNLTVDGQEIDLGGGGGGGGFTGEKSLSGFLGHFEAHHGPWSFALAPIFANIDATGSGSGGVDGAVSIHAQVHEGFVAHDLGRSWDCFAGARYYELDTSVDLSLGGVPAGSLGNNHAWVDPIVGVRYHGEFGEHWSVNARADVGGFGVGSEFAWNASALLGYHFNSCCAAQLGYRALSVNFASGSGSDRLAYDLTMAGPIIGVSFAF